MDWMGLDGIGWDEVFLFRKNIGGNNTATVLWLVMV